MMIMHDLGFPTDAIEIVKNLYEEATTQVKHPSGHSTNPIPIERGTIQGDRKNYAGSMTPPTSIKEKQTRLTLADGMQLHQSEKEEKHDWKTPPWQHTAHTKTRAGAKNQTHPPTRPKQRGQVSNPQSKEQN